MSAYGHKEAGGCNSPKGGEEVNHLFVGWQITNNVNSELMAGENDRNFIAFYGDTFLKTTTSPISIPRS